MNFREELSKIKEENMRTVAAEEEMVEFCLGGVLKYLKKQCATYFLEEVVLIIAFAGTDLSVMEKHNEKVKEIYKCTFPNYQIASNVYSRIENKLKSAGFETKELTERTVRSGKFSIKINA